MVSIPLNGPASLRLDGLAARWGVSKSTARRIVKRANVRGVLHLGHRTKVFPPEVVERIEAKMAV